MEILSLKRNERGLKEKEPQWCWISMVLREDKGKYWSRNNWKGNNQGSNNSNRSNNKSMLISIVVSQNIYI